MITKQKFKTYVEIQQSGEYNMFDIQSVIWESEGLLDKQDCLDIMKNYSRYEREFAQDKPEPGKQYALTGKKGDKCISNGNTWKESEVK